MIRQTYGKHFKITMYAVKGREVELAEVEITKSKAI
jgi:hypothetical protein